MPEVVAILFVSLVLPLVIILHYVTKWKATRGLSSESEDLLESLWRDAKAMESRINVLETILDDELPEWRKKV